MTDSMVEDESLKKKKKDFARKKKDERDEVCVQVQKGDRIRDRS